MEKVNDFSISEFSGAIIEMIMEGNFYLRGEKKIPYRIE